MPSAFLLRWELEGTAVVQGLCHVVFEDGAMLAMKERGSKDRKI